MRLILYFAQLFGVDLDPGTRMYVIWTVISNNIATLLTFKSIISKLLQPLGCHRYEFYSVHEVF